MIRRGQMNDCRTALSPVQQSFLLSA
ncbi:hypothetical protein BO443_110263 [Burkholderia orbicola]